MPIIQSLRKAISRYDDTHNFTCDICDREVFENERICVKCMPVLPWNCGAICPFCGRKTGEPGACLECKEKPLSVEKARSVFTHDGEAKRLVSRFKRGSKYLFRAAADVMLPVLNAEFPHADAITFVPMTEAAEKKRGYNQSLLLAEELSKRSGKPLIACAVKVRETAQQKTLGRRDREENLSGCFRIAEKSALKGKSVLIVDDTMTTGSTASELALLFRKAGAVRTDLLTLTSVTKNPFAPKRKPQ